MHWAEGFGALGAAGNTDDPEGKPGQRRHVAGSDRVSFGPPRAGHVRSPSPPTKSNSFPFGYFKIDPPPPASAPWRPSR